MGLLRTRAHGGGALWVLRRVVANVQFLAPLLRYLEPIFDAASDKSSRAFDERSGTDTYTRAHIEEFEVGRGLEKSFAGWKYGPVNPDFFREIMARLDLPPNRYTFLDVGAGKGLAILLASEWRFKRLLAVEFAAELVAIGKQNVIRYQEAHSRTIQVDWECQDFMLFPLPDEPTLLFLNNPFPTYIARRALEHIEAWLAAQPRDAILVYRKPDGTIAALLDGSPRLRIIEWSPYWRAYRSI